MAIVCNRDQARSYHRILQNSVVNGCGENLVRNILNLSQVRMRSVSEEKDKSEFHFFISVFSVYSVVKNIKRSAKKLSLLLSNFNYAIISI